MKHSITLRFDPDLLAKAKTMASSENRTLTNFIETLVKQRIGDRSAMGELVFATSAEDGRRRTATPNETDKMMGGARDRS
jgi:hypothetical protein